MQARVRLERLSDQASQVSLLRLGRAPIIRFGAHSQMARLAWRALALLPRWLRGSSVDLDGRLPPHRRFLVVDPAEPGHAPLPWGDQGGEILASYDTIELALALVEDERRYGRRPLIVDTEHGAPDA